MNQLISDTIKCVGVRFFANPELEDRTVPETEEMCRKTIGMLEWLKEKRPIIVMMADLQNKDPHCVQVRAMGKAVANVDKDAAPMIRGMLKASPTGKLITQIADVNVYGHGFFYVTKPIVPREFTAEEIGVDWSMWECDMPLLLPAEIFMQEEELHLVIREVLLPDIEGAKVAQLYEYFQQWMQSIRFNHSREVALAMTEYVRLLSADKREEVRQIGNELDHLRTKKGTPEVIGEMAGEWWNTLLGSSTVSDNFALIRRRAMSEKCQLLSILEYVERLMRPMPGELYNDVGDAHKFFSHLYYLAPPIHALQGVLSLMAIRTLICRELNLGMEPCFGSRMTDVKDVRDIPVTIGDVLDFADDYCDERLEKLTMQRFAEQMQLKFLNQQSEEILRLGRKAEDTTAKAVRNVAAAIRETPPHISAEKMEVGTATIDQNHAPIHIDQQSIYEGVKASEIQRALPDEEVKGFIKMD